MMAKADQDIRKVKSVREQRVARAMNRGLVGVLSLALLGLITGYVARANGNTILSGFQTGLMTLLPWAVLLMVWRGYKQMDEYGKHNLLRASSVSFVVVMLLSQTYFPLEQALKLPAMPLWILWVVGWTVWSISLAVQNRSRGA